MLCMIIIDYDYDGIMNKIQIRYGGTTDSSI